MAMSHHDGGGDAMQVSQSDMSGTPTVGDGGGSHADDVCGGAHVLWSSPVFSRYVCSLFIYQITMHVKSLDLFIFFLTI